MPPPANSHVGHHNDSNNGASQPRGSKRKQPRQQPSSAVAVDADAHMPQPPLTRQSTISELFSPSQSKSSVAKADSLPNKRRKTSHTSETMTSSSVAGAEQCGALRKPRSPARPDANSTVVDLTGSPNDSQERWDGSPRVDPPTKPASFRPYAGSKRIHIKNLRQSTRTSPEELLQRTWAQLDAALKSIFDGDKIKSSREELYRGVESVCRHHGAPQLFEKLRSRCKEQIHGSVRSALVRTAAAGNDDVEILRAVHAAWRRWSQQLLMIRSIFFYLDRSYLLLSATLPTLDDMGTNQFRYQVLYDSKLKPFVLRAMCNLVDEARDGARDTSGEAMLRDAVRMMHDLVVYTEDFEPALLISSAQYFERWADEQSSSLNLAAYIEQCAKLMDGEMARCDVFGLASSTRRELLAMLEDLLIRRKVHFLVDTNQVAKVLDSNSMVTLELLYSLLQRVNCEKRLEKPWEAYIKSVGSSIINDKERASEMVIRLLELKTRADAIWKNAFHKHEGAGHVLRESFASFINERRPGASSSTQASPGEMIAKYIDLLLRGGAKAIPSTLTSLSTATKFGVADDDYDDNAAGDEDAELNRQLDRVLDLFRFIEGKDVFEAFYKKDLARRLLMARSASADAERNMLAKLKNECGSAFTHNLEQMFKDVDLARDEMASYRQLREDSGRPSKLDLGVNVLSSAAWPSYPDVAVTVPPEIMSAIDDYDTFYKSKHTGRGLTWKHSLAHCVLTARFPRGNKELLVSSFQAIVMLLFNSIGDRCSLGYSDIQAATGLPDVELKRTLQSLACAKYQVLKKEPKGRDVNKTDRFHVNLNFSDPKYRIKINQIQLKETKEENKATHDDVNRDRQYEAQAAIVRIMKSRKTISAPELMAETINLTKNRGALETSEIKKQIDKLIEKDYLERAVEDGRMVYNYLA